MGPYGKIAKIDELQIGDVIQLSFDGNIYSHSLLVVETTADDVYVATHTFDSYRKKLSSYQYQNARMIHIEGVRMW